MLNVIGQENAALLAVKVVPGASRTRYLGEWDGRARVAVAAPPERGKANKALIIWLAQRLSIRKSDVTIVEGETSPLKTIRIDGLAPGTIRAAFEPDRS